MRKTCAYFFDLNQLEDLSMKFFLTSLFVVLILVHSINSDPCVCNYKNRCGRKAFYSSSCPMLYRQFSSVIRNLSNVGYTLDYQNSNLLFLGLNWTNPASNPSRVWNIQVGFNQVKNQCIVIETSQWDETDFYKSCSCHENMISVQIIEDNMDKFINPSDRYTIFECD